MDSPNKNIIVIVLAAIVVLSAALFLTFRMQASKIPAVATWHNTTSDTITITAPQPGQTIGKQFHVTGAARGSWYFEASFPVHVFDKNGNILIQKPAEALSNWMTTDFVQFDVALDVSTYTGPATVVLKKDNPSGDPSKDASVEIPVLIK